MGRYRPIALLLAALAISGCGAAVAAEVRHPGHSAARPSPAPSPATDQRALEAGNSAFAGRLLERLAASGANIALSPYSISEALAMTYGGGRGRTATEIAAAARFGLPPARLHGAFAALGSALAGANGPGVSLAVANALFGARGYLFRQAFLALLAHDYGGKMQSVDFLHSHDSALAAVNQWVSDHTHGKIPHLLSPSDVDGFTRLVLVNAVYLKAKWASPFAAGSTAPEPFYAPGGTVEVKTMNQTGSFPYVERTGYRALELPYQGGRLAFDVLLPAPGRLAALLRRLAQAGPLALLGDLQPTQVQVGLPKFELTTRTELAPALSAMGMPIAFAPGAADLSGIAGHPGDLYVKAVVHQAYLRVDEAGTEAAAATGVVIEPTSAPFPQPISFDVNRPFVFVLRDLHTGAILFEGVVTRPS